MRNSIMETVRATIKLYYVRVVNLCVLRHAAKLHKDTRDFKR